VTGKTRNPDVGFFDDELTREAIEGLSSVRHMTLFVGAGASLDLGLPSWSVLVSNLLQECIEKVFEVGSPVDAICRELVNLNFQVPSASVIDSILLDDVRSASPTTNETDLQSRMRAIRDLKLRSCLYKSDCVSPFPSQPTLVGKMLELLTVLKSADIDVHVITTNYDNAFEEAALRDPGMSEMAQRNIRLKPFSMSSPKGADLADGDIPIVHIHGTLRSPKAAASIGKPEIEGRIVFSEADYIAWEHSDFSSYLAHRVGLGGLLTVGASLRDNNIVSKLYEGTQGRHEPRYALMPADSDFKYFQQRGIPARYWHEMSALACRRGSLFDTKILRPEYYGQVFQFLQELGNAVASRQATATPYVPYMDRIRQWASSWAAQRELGGDLERQAIEDATRALAIEFEDIPSIEHCKIEVWSRLNPDDRTIQRWSSSQSTWKADTWPHVARIMPLSTSMAVRCFAERANTTGLLLEGSVDRWSHLVGVPIVLDHEPWFGLPVGSLIAYFKLVDSEESPEAIPAIKANENRWFDKMGELGAQILNVMPFVAR
jgi:SIR2-like domain